MAEPGIPTLELDQHILSVPGFDHTPLYFCHPGSASVTLVFVHQPTGDKMEVGLRSPAMSFHYATVRSFLKRLKSLGEEKFELISVRHANGDYRWTRFHSWTDFLEELDRLDQQGQ